jgi:hypothetical protein
VRFTGRGGARGQKIFVLVRRAVLRCCIMGVGGSMGGSALAGGLGDQRRSGGGVSALCECSASANVQFPLTRCRPPPPAAAASPCQPVISLRTQTHGWRRPMLPCRASRLVVQAACQALGPRLARPGAAEHLQLQCMSAAVWWLPRTQRQPESLHSAGRCVEAGRGGGGGRRQMVGAATGGGLQLLPTDTNCMRGHFCNRHPQWHDCQAQTLRK